MHQVSGISLASYWRSWYGQYGCIWVRINKGGGESIEQRTLSAEVITSCKFSANSNHVTFRAHFPRYYGGLISLFFSYELLIRAMEMPPIGYQSVLRRGYLPFSLFSGGGITPIQSVLGRGYHSHSICSREGVSLPFNMFSGGGITPIQSVLGGGGYHSHSICSREGDRIQPVLGHF